MDQRLEIERSRMLSRIDKLLTEIEVSSNSNDIEARLIMAQNAIGQAANTFHKANCAANGFPCNHGFMVEGAK